MELRVSTNELSVDEYRGHTALAGHDLKGVVHLGTVGDLVHLNDLECDAQGLQKIRGLFAEGAPGLREDHDLVVVDVSLDFLLDSVGVDHSALKVLLN